MNIINNTTRIFFNTEHNIKRPDTSSGIPTLLKILSRSSCSRRYLVVTDPDLVLLTFEMTVIATLPATTSEALNVKDSLDRANNRLPGE